MIDLEILFHENWSIMLTLISSELFWIADDKSQILFHDDNSYKLFIIYLNDYLNSEFSNPENNQKTSLFNLTINFCEKYKENKYFSDIVNSGNILWEFLIKEREYKNVYVSPHSLDIKITMLDLISFSGNSAKHNYFRLNGLINKLDKLFVKNNINLQLNDNKKMDYDCLNYFLEYVVENKLNYHQTKLVELLGNYFLSINRMFNSEDGAQVKEILYENLKTENYTKPSNLSSIQEIHWQLRWFTGIEDSRLTHLIPNTNKYLQLRD